MIVTNVFMKIMVINVELQTTWKTEYCGLSKSMKKNTASFYNFHYCFLLSLNFGESVNEK